MSDITIFPFLFPHSHVALLPRELAFIADIHRPLAIRSSVYVIPTKMNMENSTTEFESDPRSSEALFCSEYRDEESPGCDGPIPAQPPYRRKTWALRHLGALFIHTIIFLIYTGIGIFCWNHFILHQHGCEGSAVLYSESTGARSPKNDI